MLNIPVPVMLDTLCDYLAGIHGLFVKEMAILLRG